MNLARDLTDQRFGNWRVLHRTPTTPQSKSKGTMWTCQCACGTTRPVNAAHLLRQRSTSCGCLNPLRLPDHRVRTQRNPTYRAWVSMKTRCLNPNHPTYASHGARGITITPEWLNYDRFVADMGHRPPGTTLVRQPGSAIYGPGCCVWAATNPSPITP